MGAEPIISSFGAHYGEEQPLVGSKGSGTIFFTSCNLGCVFCQNADISQGRFGREVTIQELASIMLELERQGCHNINLVSPTIWLPQILSALDFAIEKGLSVPLVYNSGGYDNVESLKLLNGVIDIYMPDFKYSNSELAKKYSLVDNYFEIAKKAIAEMHQQVGDLQINKNGIAERGLLIRHLVLPNNLAGTEKVMEFLATLSKDTYVNIMDQYYPCHKAYKHEGLSRPITLDEFKDAIEIARKYGLHRFDK